VRLLKGESGSQSDWRVLAELHQGAPKALVASCECSLRWIVEQSGPNSFHGLLNSNRSSDARKTKNGFALRHRAWLGPEQAEDLLACPPQNWFTAGRLRSREMAATVAKVALADRPENRSDVESIIIVHSFFLTLRGVAGWLSQRAGARFTARAVAAGRLLRTFFPAYRQELYLFVTRFDES